MKKPLFGLSTRSLLAGLVCSLTAAVGSTHAQPEGIDPRVLQALQEVAQRELLRNDQPALQTPPEVLARRNSAEPWRRGSNVAPKAFGQIDEFTYQLRKEDLVRWDNPEIRVPLHLEWIQDWPRPIDKRTFRTIDPKAEFDPAHIYVAFKPGTAPERQDATIKALGGSVRRTSELVPNQYQVTTGARGVVAAVNAYLDIPEVLYAEPCYFKYTDLIPNDPSFGSLWGLRSDTSGGTHAAYAWDDGGGWTGDPNFVIAVVDSGVQINCTELNANQWVNPSPTPGDPYFETDLYGWDVVNDTNNVLPCGNSHGTHVAGTIGAVGNNSQLVVGVNWRCKIMTLKCATAAGCCDGSPPCGSMNNTADGLNYATTRGAKVSNNSYGSSNFSQFEFNTINAAQAAGHIVVATAGNSNANNDVSPRYPASYTLSNIISVAAIQEDATRASFSNFGWNSVDLAAPGVGILSTVPPCTTGTMNGTSMAAPHVAGAVALVWGRYPDLEWWKIKQRVCEGTPNPNVPCVFGAQLNIWKAMGYWVGNTTFSFGNYPFPLSPSQFGTAVNNIPMYGTVALRSGTAVTNAPATISKPMTLRSEGVVTITR